MMPMKVWIASLFSWERRKAVRQKSLPMVAYYWDGDAPVPHSIRDINSTGLYLLTDQRWYPGTLVTMTLQRTGAADTDPERSIAVMAKVIRAGADGVGLEFILPHTDGSSHARAVPASETDMKTLNKFLHRFQTDNGQALIEYILLLPMILLLVLNIVNFGGFFYAWITVANAARAGANYAALGGASASPSSLIVPTATQINDMIKAEVSSLPNRASLSVNICQNNNGTIISIQGTCSSIPADTEPTNYVLTSVDVTYTFRPFISSGFQFPRLGVYLTIPPTTIKRRAVMRTIQ